MNFYFRNARTVVVITVLVLISGSLFYWHELRPAKIKHDCSWTKVVTPAQAVRPAITKAQVQESQEEADQCIKNIHKQQAKSDNRFSGVFTDNIDNLLYNHEKRACENLIQRERAEIPAKPESYWYREAKKTEYDYCIHEHGL